MYNTDDQKRISAGLDKLWKAGCSAKHALHGRPQVVPLGLKVGMSQSAASRSAQRGRNIVEELGLNPEKSRNA